MTAPELRQYFNETFGINEWPKTFEVDEETYKNVLMYIIEWHLTTNDHSILFNDGKIGICIILGPNNKIMFKNVELILKK